MSLAKLVALAILFALGACGGGDRREPAAAPVGAWPEHLAPVEGAPAAILRRKRALGAASAAQASATVTPDQLFNWAERSFPQFFPYHAETLRQGSWTYRAYFDTGVMLGLRDGEVHVVGGPFGPAPVRVGRASDYIAPALPVWPTSLQNKQAFDGAPRVLPIPPRASWAMQTWHARAWADFEQDGTFALFVHTVRNMDTYLTPKADLYARGEYFFYRHNPSDGSYTDITQQLVENPQPGCNTPNSALVADFNRDGKPDVLVVCTGPDVPLPADAKRDINVLLLSQPDGRYRQSFMDMGEQAYPHGATVGDIDGDGYPDIVVADISQSRENKSPILAYRNNRNGTFTKTALGFDHFKGQEVWTVQLLDLRGDGNLVLWVGGTYRYGSESSIRPTHFYRLANGSFEQTPYATFDMPSRFALDYDIVVGAGRAYVMSHTLSYEGTAITRLDFSTGTATPLWSNTGDYGLLFDSRPECRGISGKTLDIIRTRGNLIVTDDACRTPDVPM